MLKNILKIYAIIGLIVLIIGIIFGIALGTFTLYIIIPMTLGLIGILAYIIFCFEEIRNMFNLKSTRYNLNQIILVLSVLLLLIMLNFLSSRHHHRFDLTFSKRFSLAPQTIKILQQLKTPIHLIGFFKTGTSEQIEDLLYEYNYHNKLFTYEIIDPDREPSKTRDYGSKLNYGDVFLEIGEKREKINKITEVAITNAIRKLLSESQKTIYFIEGHNEAKLESFETTGYNKVRDALINEGYRINKLTLPTITKLPDDCSVLVLAGPHKDLLEGEIKLLDEYLKNGGRILFLIDPEPLDRIQALLSEYYINISDDVIIDILSKQYGGDAFIPIVTQYGAHPIVMDFEIITFYPLARSVWLADSLPSGVLSSNLALTSENSWAETNPEFAKYNEDEDRKGPISLAAAVQIPVDTTDSQSITSLTRIVTIGDADFADNSNFLQQGNGDFFLNCINWLAEDEEYISIRPKQRKETILFITAQQNILLAIFAILVMPFTVLIVGIRIWWNRR